MSRPMRVRTTCARCRVVPGVYRGRARALVPHAPRPYGITVARIHVTSRVHVPRAQHAGAGPEAQYRIDVEYARR
jgi:hypothetical protein